VDSRVREAGCAEPKGEHTWPVDWVRVVDFFQREDFAYADLVARPRPAQRGPLRRHIMQTKEPTAFKLSRSTSCSSFRAMNRTIKL